MLPILTELKNWTFNVQRNATCGWVFFFAPITGFLLLIMSVIVTTVQYVGEPIECMVDDRISTNIVNSYCWISSTYTIPSAFNKKIGFETAHPGVASENDDGFDRKYYTYYQWVPIMLFIQSALCCLPYLIWSHYEGNLINSLLMNLRQGIQDARAVSRKKILLVRYLLSHIKNHNGYVFGYFLCEVFLLVIIAIQVQLMDWFMGGEFMTYGLKVIKFLSCPEEERYDPMVYIFPRVTKCLFRKYGPSGSLETYDFMCVLAVNNLNEKIYIALWFWYLILAVCLIIVLSYRLMILVTPLLRSRVLAMHSRLAIDVCRSLNNKIMIGDWWILYRLSSVMDPVIYNEVLQEFSKELGANISV